MKSNKVITALIAVAVVLALVLAGVIGFIYYRNTHVFIEGVAYAKNSQSLDLREEDISFNHYLMLEEQLPECSILWSVPFHGARISSGTTELTVKDLTESDVDLLCRYFPELQKVDASSCSNYSILELLQKKAPQLEVIYQVSLGSKSFAPDTEDLVLKVGEYDYDIMLKNLPYLKNLKTIQLKAPELSKDQLQFLRDAHPDIKITSTVAFFGKEYDVETVSLDLSDLTPDMIDTAIEKMSLLPELENVNLDYAEGESHLSKEDARKLMKAFPDLKFNYSFEFYGKKLNSQTEEVVFKDRNIGDDAEKEIRLALDLLQGCKRFVLDNCKMSNEVMAKLRNDYRDRTKVVWRVWFGEGTSLTDAEILRSTYNVEDDNCEDLVYLEDVRYMDLGHNEFLDGASFIAGMPNLEVCIISGAPIKSLEPFANCKNLRVLEMANCIYVKDLEPLRNLENLEMLNIGFTRLTSLEPIEDLKLTHLTVLNTKVPLEDRAAYAESHPDCWVVAKGDQPYGVGWRYDENKKPLPWYAEITEVFRYPKSPNNVGWYLEKKQDTKE